MNPNDRKEIEDNDIRVLLVDTGLNILGKKVRKNFQKLGAQE